MPRKKQPQSLRSSSLRTLAKLVLDSTKKSNGKQEPIQEYVKDIPNTFANDYVNEVLQLSSRGNSCFDITSALHPKCTKIVQGGDGDFFCSRDQVLRGFHVMGDLIIIEPEIRLRESQSNEGEGLPFPKMTNLRSIKVSIEDRQLLEQVIENCPGLEDITIVDVNENWATPSILQLLSNCKHLKRIFVASMTPRVAIYLLNRPPNLDLLAINHIQKILPLCKHAYKLKDFRADLNMKNVANLQKIVTHFPDLEKLDLLVEDNVPVNMISELADLKSLKLIYHKIASNHIFLMDKCIFGLHDLYLDHTTGFDYLFRQNINASYPNLVSLTLFDCSDISVAGIKEIFPNLKSLKLIDCTFMANDPPCKLTYAGFDALEDLQFVNVPVQPVRSVIPFCGKLKSLMVYHHNSSLKSSVYELLCNANLKQLRTLQVMDDSVKRDVIPIVFNSCGEVLEKVELWSDNLTLSPDFLCGLYNEMKQYDMLFFINGTLVLSS